MPLCWSIGTAPTTQSSRGQRSAPFKTAVSDKPASLPGLEDFETIAQEVSSLGQRVSDLEARLEHVEKVNTGLEEAALTTARALQDISTHWDKVYEAIRRKELPVESP